MKKLLVNTFLVAGLAGSLLGQPTYNITTVAGSATGGLGDGGTAAQAELIQPWDVKTDAAGNVYISDPGNQRVRKIDGVTGNITTLTTAIASPRGLALDSTGAFIYTAHSGGHRIRKIDTTTGAVTTVAGTGDGGYTGDGHLATLARLRNPRAVWVDANNNIFIADTDNNRIRKVTAATGIITTIAGRGPNNSTVATPSGNAPTCAQRPDGTIPTVGPCAAAINNPAGDGGPAILAQLANPEGIIGDASGNIFFSDTNFHRIRKIDTNGIITTVAGIGTAGSADGVDATLAQFNHPRGIAWDAAANLDIADSDNGRVRQWNPTSNLVRTIAGLGTSSGSDIQAQLSGLNLPTGVGIDSAGNVLVADSNNSRVRKIDGTTGIVQTLSGSSQGRGDGGAASLATLNQPRGVAVDSAGNLLISDTNSQKVRKISNGIISTFAGTGSGGFTFINQPPFNVVGQGANIRLNFPGCVALDAVGSVYIADRANSRIVKVDPLGNGTVVAGSVSLTANNSGSITGGAVATGFNNDGTPAFMARPGLNTAGAGLGTLSSGSSTNSNGPNCVTVDNNGNLYIADTGNNVIRTVSAATGAISTIGGFIVKTTDKNGVTVNTGVAGSEGDGGLAVNAQFSGPQGVGVNPQGTLLCVADTGNATVRQINLATGGIITIAGITGDSSSDGNLPTSGWLSRLSGPQGCVMDAKGNTYIADTGNSRIVLVDPTGKMFQIAGGGSVFASDGKSATTAQLFAPVGIAVDGAGNVFFTDRFGLIKELTPNP